MHFPYHFFKTWDLVKWYWNILEINVNEYSEMGQNVFCHRSYLERWGIVKWADISEAERMKRKVETDIHFNMNEWWKLYKWNSIK